ncbi:plasmid replication initiator TrfA [Chitinilyticum aquatile]|uniref:plasmid replication initiator TrfA n=1 Tax=Chitinilyticum aquatile TaxID=362520 RepID=UPI0004918364|nr:plasmid replication initiator TrfA [Chitinilyticum aquatile]
MEDHKKLPKAPLAALQDRAEEAKARMALRPMSQQLDLFWGESARPMASALTKSALFGTSRPPSFTGELDRLGQPMLPAMPFMKNQEIFSTDDIILYYTGEELTQDDLTLWMQIVFLSRDRPMDDLTQRTRPYRLLKDLDWGDSKPAYFRLKSSITRLRNATLRIQQRYRGEKVVDVNDVNFLDHLRYIDDESGNSTGEIEFRADRRILEIFRPELTSVHNWTTRQTIQKTRNRLAQWTHSFYSNHSGKPYPMLLTTLMSLSKTKTKDVYRFKQQLEVALAVLIKVGFLLDWQIEGTGVKAKLHVTLKKQTKAALPSPDEKLPL